MHTAIPGLLGSHILLRADIDNNNNQSKNAVDFFKNTEKKEKEIRLCVF